MTIQEIIELLQGEFENLSITLGENAHPPTLLVESADLTKVCRFLNESDKTFFDYLSCVTGVDNGPEEGDMEVIYHLYSIPYDISLALKVKLSRENPIVDSVFSIWRSANWLERETYDLLGIEFTNHPDLRRILLPDNWEGFPLRKDYETQEYFHGIKVDY